LEKTQLLGNMDSRVVAANLLTDSLDR